MLEKVLLVILGLVFGVLACALWAYISSKYITPWFTEFTKYIFGSHSYLSRMLDKQNQYAMKQYFAIYFIVYLLVFWQLLAKK